MPPIDISPPRSAGEMPLLGWLERSEPVKFLPVYA
jgi:hypothetical protein